MALTWSDFAGERLTIRRSVVESDGRLIERRTKTDSKGHRTIAVDAETLRAVDELRQRQAKLAAERLEGRERSAVRDAMKSGAASLCEPE